MCARGELRTGGGESESENQSERKRDGERRGERIKGGKGGRERERKRGMERKLYYSSVERTEAEGKRDFCLVFNRALVQHLVAPYKPAAVSASPAPLPDR